MLKYLQEINVKCYKKLTAKHKMLVWTVRDENGNLNTRFKFTHAMN